MTLDADESHHLSTVLRGGRDHVLDLVDGRGHAVDRQRPRAAVANCALVEILTVHRRPLKKSGEPRLVLACAVVKGKRFEWVLEKAVELGAHQILPLRCRARRHRTARGQAGAAG